MSDAQIRAGIVLALSTLGAGMAAWVLPPIEGLPVWAAVVLRAVAAWITFVVVMKALAHLLDVGR